MRFTYHDNIIYELSKKKLVKIGLWEEENLFLVHIRDYTKNCKNKNEYQFSKKGIALTIEVWKTLNENIQQINQDVMEMYEKLVLN